MKKPWGERIRGYFHHYFLVILTIQYIAGFFFFSIKFFGNGSYYRLRYEFIYFRGCHYENAMGNVKSIFAHPLIQFSCVKTVPPATPVVHPHGSSQPPHHHHHVQTIIKTTSTIVLHHFFMVSFTKSCRSRVSDPACITGTDCHGPVTYL